MWLSNYVFYVYLDDVELLILQSTVFCFSEMAFTMLANVSFHLC